VADVIGAMTVALICFVTLQTAAAEAVPAIPTPVIPPSYRPEQARDERGLWLELDDYEKAVRRSPLRIRGTPLAEYIQGLVCRIGKEYCGDFRVYVLRNPYFNASMAANGMMQVWTGVLTRVGSEDELATVIGHEIAHYELAHTLAQFRKIKKGMAIGSIFDFGLAIVGVPLPVGQMTAVLNVLAFSRQEEEEADLLGAKLMVEAGFDPHATYRIWRDLIEEDARAEVKREEPGLFTKTHPESAARAQVLEAWANSVAWSPVGASGDAQAFRALLAANYGWLMEDQIKTARYGRTEYLLERQEQFGMPEGFIHFYRAQMLMQRAGAGDVDAAKTEYALATSASTPPPEAFRNYGYLLLKENDATAAAVQFKRYLAADPDATDRAMIESYLAEAR
jgi:predicted Zn-dependent protease